MIKNKNTKNISFNNYEFISIFLIILFSLFMSIIPKNIILTCKSASVIGTLFLIIISYIVYYFLTKKTYDNEYDFFVIIKKTFPKIIQIIIGISLFAFALFYVYTSICDVTFSLKNSTYNITPFITIALYFLIALLIMTKNGLNSLFRISGYVAHFIFIIISILFIVSLPRIKITNFLPIFGSGIKDVFFINLQNISLFTPLLFTLFFGHNILRKDKNGKTNKNYVKSKNRINKIMFIFSLTLLMIIILYCGTMPTSLIEGRTALLFDVSRFITYTTTGLETAPFLIAIFSFISFLETSFVFLVGLTFLEKLGVVKDYRKLRYICIIVLFFALLMTSSMSAYIQISSIFNFVSIGVGFIFPIITLILYSLKNRKSKKIQGVLNES